MKRNRRNFIKNTSILAGSAMMSSLFFNCKKANAHSDKNDLTHPNDFGAEHIISYPAAPDLLTSVDFSIWANGKPVWVERYEVPTPTPPYAGGWNSGEESFVSRAYRYIGDVQRMAIGRFAATGTVTITIDCKDPIKTCVIRPKSKAISVVGLGTRRVEFQISGLQKLYIEIDNLPPLVLFSDFPETNVPNEGDSNVLYFGPGKHHVGKISLNTNDTVYLAPGSIVYGQIYASNCWNVKIKGRGILDATNYAKDNDFLNAIYAEWSNGVHVEDVLIRNKTRGWMCNMAVSRNVSFDNVKVLGFGANNDGIDVNGSSGVSIKDSFFRCTDDCIAIKSKPSPGDLTDVEVNGCTLYGVASSDGFTVAYELRGPVSYIRMINCDIIGGEGESTAGGHCAFSVICDGPGPVTDILFENIRVEDKVEYSNFDIIVTNGQHYVKMPPGRISQVILRNVHWERGDVPIHIRGYDQEHQVSDVTFENCTVGGKPLQEIFDSVVLMNEFSRNILFKNN